jgi:hypothetical protein
MKTDHIFVQHRHIQQEKQTKSFLKSSAPPSTKSTQRALFLSISQHFCAFVCLPGGKVQFQEFFSSRSTKMSTFVSKCQHQSSSLHQDRQRIKISREHQKVHEKP